MIGEYILRIVVAIIGGLIGWWIGELIWGRPKKRKLKKEIDEIRRERNQFLRHH